MSASTTERLRRAHALAMDEILPILSVYATAQVCVLDAWSLGIKR